jgi:hypothetical protein
MGISSDERRFHSLGSAQKGNPSLKSFLFALTNPHGIKPRIFRLKAEEKDQAICCDSKGGPTFRGHDLAVSPDCHRWKNPLHLDIADINGSD